MSMRSGCGEHRDDADLILVDTRRGRRITTPGILAGARHFDPFPFHHTDTSRARRRGVRRAARMDLFGARNHRRARPSCFYENESGMRAARGALGARIRRAIQGANARRRAQGNDGREVDDGGREVCADGFPDKSARGDSRDVSTRCSSSSGVATCKSSTCAAMRNITASACARNMAARFPARIHQDWTAVDCGGRKCEIGSGIARAVRKRSASIPQTEIIPYCQGGYRAAHAYLALKIAGYPRVRNYLGSWAEWGNRDDLPSEHPRRK